MFKKRVIALVVCFAMLFSIMIPAFAVTPSDVVGTEFESSVGKLTALGIIEGYEDGSFKAENEITRAEFAKIACYLIGVQSAAELSKGSTSFSDVKADHWASGYINIAAQKGLLKGYPDGTFGPSNNVTYAEAITILVRAVGLGPLVEGNGTWPSNYMAKASEVGITDTISGFSGSTPATRGNIAKLCWETLATEKWGETGYTNTGIEYGPLGKSLLEEKYPDFTNAQGEAKYFEDATVIATSLIGGLDANKIELEKELIGEKLDGIFGANTTIKELAEGVNVDVYSLLGKKVNVLLGKDNKIQFIEVLKDSSVEGTVDSITLKTGGDSHNGKIEINGTSYTLARQARMYVNTENLTATGTTGEMDSNLGAAGTSDGLDEVKTVIGDSAAKATLSLDKNGLVSTINIFVADSITLANAVTNQFVIGEITENDAVKDVHNETEQFNIETIEDKQKLENFKTVIIRDGVQVDGSELKVGDVVTHINNGDVHIVIASSQTISGNVSNVAADKTATDGSLRYKVTIGGKVYKMSMDGSTLLSKTDDLEKTEKISTAMKDFYEEDVTIRLNSLGNIVMINGDVTSASSTEYGVITKAPWEGNPDSEGKVVRYIKIRTGANEERIYAIEGDNYKELNSVNSTLTAALTPAINTATVGSFVQFKVESTGKIKANNLIVYKENAGAPFNYEVKEATLENYVAVGQTVTTVNDTSRTVTAGGVRYYVDDDTVILNRNAGSIEKLAWSQVVDGNGAAGTILDTSTGGITIVYDKTTKTIEQIIGKWNPVDYLSSDENYGIFVEIRTNADGDDVIVLNVAGEEKQYVMAEDLHASIEQGDLIKYDINGEDEFMGASGAGALIVDVSNEEANASITDKIYSVKTTESLIIFNNSVPANRESEKLDEDVVIYDARDVENISIIDIDDLSSDMYARIAVTEDDLVTTLVIFK